MATLTPAQVAEDLHVSTEAVMAKLRDGTLPGFKFGRLWRIDAGEYAAWKAGPARPADPHRIEPRSSRGTANITRRRRAS